MAVVKSLTVSGGLISTGSGGTLDTADVTNDAITFAKMQNVATATLLGRGTSGTGDIESVTPSTTFFTMAAGALSLANNCIGSSQMANNTVNDAILADRGACSVIGRSANSTGDPADISAGTDDYALFRVGAALGFYWAPRIWTGANPTSSSSTGTLAHITFDSSYLYVCTATDTWRRVALSTF